MAPKSGKRGKKKAALTKRRDAIIQEMGKRKQSKAMIKAKEERKRRNQLARLARDYVVPFHPKQRILLVGEADFSFAKALLAYWKEKHLLPGNGLLIATTLETKEEIYDKYRSTARENIRMVRKYERSKVLTRVDATNLHSYSKIFKEFFGAMQVDMELRPEFDRIVFNFPHLGTGETDKIRSIMIHQTLVCQFLKSAEGFLAPKGEIYVTIKKGEPYRSWKLGEQAKKAGVVQLRRVDVFLPSAYPGYSHRRTVGEAFKSPEHGGPQENATVGQEARSYVFVTSQLRLL